MGRTASGWRARAHSVLTGLVLLPEVVLAGMVGYLTVVTGAAWFARRRGRTGTSCGDSCEHRFVILVPAHNEARLIESTVRAMVNLDYPSARYQVHVVADNCTDDTAEIARRAGATVHERTDPQNKGKGPALMWLLDRLWTDNEPHDAVMIVDADSTLSPNFLRVMDRHLSSGDRVIQAYYAVRDPGSSWAVGIRYAGLATRHYLRPLGRNALGGSCGLYGNGMVFAADVLRRHAWSSHLTEDIELQLELLLEGQPVAFAPDAIVEAEMPTTLARSTTQNERWERGRLELACRYVPRLLRAPTVRRRHQRIAQLDAVADQLVPPFSLLVAATGFSAAASQILVRLRPTPLARLSSRLGIGLVVGQMAYLLSGLRMVRAPRSVYLSLLRAPFFVIWKLRLWLRVLVRPEQVAWVRTGRNDEGLPLGDLP